MPKGYSNKPRSRVGNPPKDGTIIGNHKSGWILYQRSVANKGDETWVNVKLIAADRQPHKANFWLAYCLERGDFMLNRDMRTLDVTKPDLLNWVALTVVEVMRQQLEDLFK